MKLTAVFMAVPEGYIGFVEELPGANTKVKRLRRLAKICKRLCKWYSKQTENWLPKPSLAKQFQENRLT